MRSIFLVVAIVICVFTWPSLSLAETKAVHPTITASKPSPIPFKQDSATPNISVSRVVFAFLLLVVILIALAFVMKRVLRYQGVAKIMGGARISLRDTKRLSPKTTVYLLSVDDTEYLLAQSGDQLQFMKHKPEVIKNNESD